MNSEDIFGNVPVTVIQGAPAEVEQDVKEQMDILKPRGRRVAGCSRSFVNYIPQENFVTMLNAIHEFWTC